MSRLDWEPPPPEQLKKGPGYYLWVLFTALWCSAWIPPERWPVQSPLPLEVVNGARITVLIGGFFAVPIVFYLTMLRDRREVPLGSLRRKRAARRAIDRDRAARAGDEASAEPEADPPER